MGARVDGMRLGVRCELMAAAIAGSRDEVGDLARVEALEGDLDVRAAF